MARHVLLVLTNPVADREAEYNRWYDEVHLGEVLGVKGFVGGQRFRLADAQIRDYGERAEHRYLALYEIETDDLAAVIQALSDAKGTMLLSDAVADDDTLPLAYSAIGERLEAPGHSRR